MRHPRFLTAAGSAAAAMIAIAAFVVIAPNGKVEAATIFKSFRSTVLDGFQLSFKDIGEDGVRVNGQMFVLFEPGAAGDSDRKLDALYLDAHIQADETHEEIPGIDINTALSISDEGQWLFLKLSELSEELIEEEPMLGALAVYAEQGVVLKLDGVLEKLRDHLSNDAFHSLFSELHEVAEPHRRTVEISIGDSPDDSDGDASQGMNFSIRTSGKADVDGLEASVPEIAALMKSLLLGTAGSEEIEALMTFVEQAARDVQVVEREPGLHVLTIRELDVPDDEGDEEAEMIAALEIEMCYREGQGIEWAEVRHVGRYDGTVRISSASRADLTDLSDVDRVIEPGETTVIDLSAFMPLIEAAIEQHQP